MNLENSLFSVLSHRFEKTLDVPTSKSYANRALILGALRGNEFIVRNIPTSTDVENLLRVFLSLGISFTKNNANITFHNSFPESEKNLTDNVIDLHTGDGGTTNRFLIALLSRGKKTYQIFPSEKMRERPIDDLLAPLKKLGVKISIPSTGPWVIIQGPALVDSKKEVEIDCSKSTQFASALLLSFSDTPIHFKLSNILASEKYLDMTKHLLTEKDFLVPADFSSLSYPVALALIEGAVLIKNCKSIDPFQADSIFLKLLKDNGADLEFTEEGLRITSQNSLKPFAVDGSTCPDLIPTLVFLASRIEGESSFSNLEVLRYKESDRINEILNLLKVFKVDYDFDIQTTKLIIRGSRKKLPAVTCLPERDHRIVMVAYLFMRANNGGLLGNTDCVNKSYPKFFEDLD